MCFYVIPQFICSFAEDFKTKKMKKLVLLLNVLLASLIHSQVGINTTAPTQTLDVNGDARIRNLPTLTSPTVSALFSDENGVLGKATISPQSQIAFYTASSNIPFTASSFNAGTDQVVPIVSSYATLNTIGTTVPTTGNVRISQTGTYMLSASVAPFLAINEDTTTTPPPNSTTITCNGDGLYVYMAINIDISTNGGTSWTSVSGGRPMFPRVVSLSRTYSFTAPSVIKQLNAGDLVRVRFYRSTAGSVTQGCSVSSIELSNTYGSKPFTLGITKL